MKENQEVIFNNLDQSFTECPMISDEDMVAVYEYVYTRGHKIFNAFFPESCEDDYLDRVLESILRGIEAWSGFRGECKTTTWFFGIFINHVKTQSVRLTGSDISYDNLDLGSDGNRSFLDILDCNKQTSPEEQLLGEELKDFINLAYLSCTREMFDNFKSFIMYEELKMSYKEISATLEITESAVKSRIHRARDFIKNRLLSYDPEIGGIVVEDDQEILAQRLLKDVDELKLFSKYADDPKAIEFSQLLKKSHPFYYAVFCLYEQGLKIKEISQRSKMPRSIIANVCNIVKARLKKGNPWKERSE